MRPVRYRVAASLDGFIAGPNGEVDWIRPDPTLDYATVYAEYDTALLGRRTYELTQRPGAPAWPEGWSVYVFSSTLDSSPDPAVRIVKTEAAETVARLRQQSGKSIWLFGGGVLFGSLVAAGLVDEIELAVMPVLLHGGVPFLPPGGPAVNLSLLTVRESANSIVRMSYRVLPG
jgi:dihydrofolate reductase